jgi:tetratricopeptide (TPR) repeat protein
LLTNLATALEMQNDLDGAAHAARQALQVDPAAIGPQYLLARLDHRSGRFNEARSRLEPLLAQELTPAQAIDAWFELGLVLDRLGEAAEALQAFDRGNALAGESPAARNAQGARFLRHVEVNRAWFTVERLRSAPRAEGEDGRRPPVFFVGFPRSGTTLAERILAAHPKVVTTEENSPLASLLRPYLRSGAYPEVLGG